MSWLVNQVELSDLEKEGLIGKIPIDKKRVEQCVEIAKRDLETAQSLSEDNPDWAFSIAYNSMLQSARALMFSMGFRPQGQAQHISAVRFAEAVLGNKAEEIIVVMDRMRRKRHRVVYDTSGLISIGEANRAVTNAENFFKLMENELKKRKFIK